MRLSQWLMQFWDELDEIVSANCETHGLIDDALRSYLTFTANYKGEYLSTEYDIARCSYKLLDSALFSKHKDYVRWQIVYSLLQEDSPDTLHLIVAFLLYDGKQDEATFVMMKKEGVFPRLLELLQERKDDNVGLHRMFLELLYEMSRIQRLRIEDLSVSENHVVDCLACTNERLAVLIEDEFIAYLLAIIEGLSDDVNDPYHYPVIRVLLILNEQYMVSAHDPGPDQPHAMQLTNKVVKSLSLHGSAYKTFGENIILLLNRESETSLQLLILKLLYLLFTTPSTYEYFYTNDLRVLVDVMIRNLLDLPFSATALRHTYLRVLYPLLAHTQLKHPPHYKRDELLRLLTMMTSTGGAMEHHFGAVDETTKRLVGRCVGVPWLREEVEGEEEGSGSGSEQQAKKKKKKLLDVALAAGMASALSVVEVTTQKEKPGVQTPSLGRKAHDHEDVDASGGKSGGDAAEAEISQVVVVPPPEKSPFEVDGDGDGEA
ncbi:MAG: hypothetical protein LQ342_001401 [Letrouitia transgressa]|nr:MAG: hypothetical protein LQ342_001401 [Letrouitia transgressa]